MNEFLSIDEPSWAQYDKYCAGSSQAVTENMDRGGEWAHWHLTEQVHTHTYTHFRNSVSCSARYDFMCVVLSSLSFVCFYVLNVKVFSGWRQISGAVAVLCGRQLVVYWWKHSLCCFAELIQSVMTRRQSSRELQPWTEGIWIPQIPSAGEGVCPGTEAGTLSEWERATLMFNSMEV